MSDDLLASTSLFSGIEAADVHGMLDCLGMFERRYAQGSRIHRVGDRIRTVGIMKEGRVRIESVDVWGNVSIVGFCGPGERFGEAYAAAPGTPLLVDVIAEEDSVVIFLNMEKIVTTCPRHCAAHQTVIRNLTVSLAQHNLAFSRRLLHVTPKTIRGKLLAYLSDRAECKGSKEFDIPLNRQQLADYLGVDRSALSAEISRMSNAGIIKCQRSHFTLLE